MLSKKLFSTFLICFSIIFLYSQENDIFLIYKLCLSALENNSDIKVAEKNYNSAILSEKSANVFFHPQYPYYLQLLFLITMNGIKVQTVLQLVLLIRNQFLVEPQLELQEIIHIL